jgi:hypothetical protein
MNFLDWPSKAAARAFGVVVALALLVPGAALGQTSSTGCSWLGESDQRDVNIGAPDLNAQYLYAPLDGLAGSQIAITGSYPHARYFSFTLYGSNQQSLTSIYDRQIAPDRGGYNPFSKAGAPGQSSRYTVHVLFEDAPKRPAPNTLYAGKPGAAGTLGFLVLRIYLPRSPASPSGDVPWPQVHVLSADGTPQLSEGACATIPPSFGAWYWQQKAAQDAPAGQATPADATTAPPAWTRSFDNGFGNDQNSYLQVLVSHHWGELVVSHFKAPTFPDEAAGRPVRAGGQLRYWSVCTYDSSGTAVFGCVADRWARQRKGWVTYVVSEAGHRPRNATAAHGVSWLPWGPDNTIQIMERNMLPAASFTGASQRIRSPGLNPRAAQLMGDYYPTSAYCSRATFERGGWQACLPRLARELRQREAKKHHAA